MSGIKSQSSPILRLWCCILGVILTVSGLFFAIEGGKLVSLGGSWYFLIAGIVMVLSAIQYFRSKSSAVTLFILVFIGTLIWSLFDAGWDFWPLISRLMVPTGFMLLGFATWPTLRKKKAKPASPKCPTVSPLCWQSVWWLHSCRCSCRTRPSPSRVTNCL